MLMSRSCCSAARTGIRHCPAAVLYMTGGFAARPLSERQRRFDHQVGACLRLLDVLRARTQARKGRIGCALHSLRAVPPQAMREVLAALPLRSRACASISPSKWPEVDGMRGRARDARPVQWLLDNADVDARWTLVHATTWTRPSAAASPAAARTVAICTTTEANLGDGLFPLRDYPDATGGRWGVGPISHLGVAGGGIALAEYGQRLRAQRRNIASSMRSPSVGATCRCRGVLASSADSTSFAVDDRIVLDAEAPILSGAVDADLVDRWIFSGNANVVRDVDVAGVRVVGDGRHRERDAVAALSPGDPGRCWLGTGAAGPEQAGLFGGAPHQPQQELLRQAAAEAGEPPSAPMTRWQGSTIGSGLRPVAAPTARVPLGLPMRRAKVRM